MSGNKEQPENNLFLSLGSTFKLLNLLNCNLKMNQTLRIAQDSAKPGWSPWTEEKGGCKAKTVTILKMVYYPELSVWVSQEPFPNKEMEGRLPKGRLPVPKEVNRKKNDETEAASLTPLGSNELHCPRISYLHSF
ncbi:neuronal regeneration-related protein isoform X1 [Rhinolophus sinicus]|uniref:neuronal regeneration-related protein isoform X1 n=1 Tax=Rhinolophus sinicus TaxID=89399 RepID=UPI0009453534|nr:PREDICTED: neuronal regeneration-related protein isoform X1 [Rhinolophus sinicus]